MGNPQKPVEKAGSSVELSADHPIPRLGTALIMESLGTADFDFYGGSLTQLADVGTQEKTPDERGTNFMLAIVRGIGPKDGIEAGLRFPHNIKGTYCGSISKLVRW